MVAGDAPELAAETSFVGRWMDMLRPGAEEVANIADPAARREALEKRAVVLSLENLMGFPFVRAAVEADDLSLHGVWHDISGGGLQVFDPVSGGFHPV
jgi:carbonic anhydrase